MNLFGTLRNSVNVVTGANSGLGRHMVKYLFDCKASSVLGIDTCNDRETYDYIGVDCDDPKFKFETFNTYEEEKVTESLREFTKKHGPIDNLINAAGISRAYPFYSKTSDRPYKKENCDDIIKFNILGTFVTTRAVVKDMIDHCKKQDNSHHKPRCIINVSSISSQYPDAGQSFYAASCGAIDSSTLASARELAPYNIRVNTINVGYFATRLIFTAPRNVLQMIEKSIALLPNRLGEPDDFAHLAKTLIENQMINGACIRLDAGAREVNILSMSGQV